MVSLPASQADVACRFQGSELLNLNHSNVDSKTTVKCESMVAFIIEKEVLKLTCYRAEKTFNISIFHTASHHSRHTAIKAES